MYVRLKGKVHPVSAFGDAVIACAEDLFARIIRTSRSPRTVLRRIAILKADPRTRGVIWAEAFLRVVERADPLTVEDLERKHGQEYHLIDLEKTK